MGLCEVLTTASARSEQERALLVSAPAADFLHGVVDVEYEAGGWVRPRRFVTTQVQALTSCLAWHPGLFRQMAATTAGVCVRFATDANEVALAVMVDDEPPGTAAVLKAVDKDGSRLPHDGVSAMVDGASAGCALPRVYTRSMAWMSEPGPVGIVSFRLLDAAGGPGDGIVALPGLGARHEVCLWLPCLRGCKVRELWCDGTFLEPVADRGRLLVLGDSLGQGFCCDDPARSWPALLSDALDLDLLNQSVGGQVFQPSSLAGAPQTDVARIVVELGTNYRWERCSTSEASRDVRAFVAEVARMWPEVPTTVVTPPWHDEDRVPIRPGSCYDWVGTMLEQAVEGHASIKLVDGLDLVDHDPALFPDGEHLGATANEQLFRGLKAAMRVRRRSRATKRASGGSRKGAMRR